MREVLPTNRRAVVVLIALACGCGSSIDGDMSDGAGGAAGDSTMPPLSASGAGGAGSAGQANGGRGATPMAGRGGAGSGGAMAQPTAGMSAAGGGGGGGGRGGAPANPGDCFDATMLWFDDFETGDYSRWTSNGYGNEWGDDCQSNGLSQETSVSGSTSQRSEVTCVYTADEVHRGYGGLQFSGDEVESSFTNEGTGTDAPDGLVNTMWMRIDSPTVFRDGKWLDLWTVNAACDWSDSVLTLGIEDESDLLAAAHYWVGNGTREFEPGAPGIPRGEWFRVTIYFNFYDGVMHVWQNGESISHVTFARPINTVCQWHWGLYASADNDDIVLFEDDKSIWKLNEPWDDFSVEPYFGEEIATCD